MTVFVLPDSSNERPVLNKTSKSSKKKYPSTSSEERLMSDEHDDCNVTDYVMEYTGLNSLNKFLNLLLNRLDAS